MRGRKDLGGKLVHGQFAAGLYRAQPLEGKARERHLQSAPCRQVLGSALHVHCLQHLQQLTSIQT